MIMLLLECLRRIAILSVIPWSAFLIFDTRPEYLRLTLVNWEQRRDREVAALLSEEARNNLAAYVAEETAGRVVSLRSDEWGTFFREAQRTLSGHPPSSDWRRTLGPTSSHRAAPTLFFPLDDARFAELLTAPAMSSAGVYLQIEHASSPPALYLSVIETRYSVDDPPQRLIHPLRHTGWWILLVGVAIYGLLPWPKESEHELRITTPVKSFLTDVVGVLLFGITTTLWVRLVLSPDIPGHGEWLQILVLSSVFGVIALAGVAVLLIALSQSQLRLEWNDSGLTFHSMRQSTTHAWTEIVSFDVSPLNVPYANAIRWVGLILSLFNWRAAGPALLVQTESRALRFAMRHGSELTIDSGNATLRNLCHLNTEFEARSISVTPSARQLAEVERQSHVPFRWPVHLAVGLLVIPVFYALVRTAPD